MKLTDMVTHAQRTRIRTTGQLEPNRTQPILFSPLSLSNCALWYDLSNDINNDNTSLNTIADQSGNNRTGSCINIYRCKHPITGKTGFMTKTVASSVTFTTVSIRTVAIVCDYCGGYGSLISASNNYNWQASSSYCLTNTAASAVKNGSWRINGVSIAPLSYRWQTSPQVVTVVTTGNVNQNRLGDGMTDDNTVYGNNWKYYEVIFYTNAKSASEIRQLEVYLASKWKVPLEI